MCNCLPSCLSHTARGAPRSLASVINCHLVAGGQSSTFLLDRPFVSSQDPMPPPPPPLAPLVLNPIKHVWKHSGPFIPICLHFGH